MAECSKGWGNRCPKAKSKKCRCKCGGENHGNPAARSLGEQMTMKLTDSKIFAGAAVREFIRRADHDIVLTRDAKGMAQCSLRQTLVVHSPTGFEWGYAGSGPADLALNILARFVNPAEAYRLHQEYKRDVIAKLATTGVHTIKAESVIEWIERKWAVDAIVGQETALVQ